MKSSYWNALKGRYEDEVCNVLGADSKGVVRRAIARFGKGARLAADFGCGTGRAVELLAARFDEVYACDFARKLLEVARTRAEALDNVTVERIDLVRGRPPVRGVELALCLNVLLSPSDGDRRAMLRTVAGCMKRDGHLILVVPSLESALFCNARLLEWKRRARKRGKTVREAAIRADDATARDLTRGIVRLDTVRTKHHLQEEARLALDDAGFDVVTTERVEYPWNTQFNGPPRWMREPLPWDWLLVGRRR